MNFFINRNFLQLFIWFIFFNHAFSDPYKNLNTDFLEKKKIKQKTSKKVSLKNKSSQKTFEDIIKDFKKIEGLFTIYWNENNNKAYVEILPDQFETIYLAGLTRQSGDAFLLDGSSMLDEYPFMFKKVGERIQYINVNLKFRAETNSPFHKSVESHKSNSILASTKIVSKPHPETGAILANLSDIFLYDIERITMKSQGVYSFDKKDSYFKDIKSFPFNSEIEVSLHFKGKKPIYIYTLPNSSSMISTYHISLSKIKETDYLPRISDDRIGHFTTIYQDYTDLRKDSPYIRYINRWDLRKKNPTDQISEPIKPIVYWIENTVPYEFRDAVREGILAWNEAFEAAGFKNAIIVKQMPENATWDPADVRYNTIRWIFQPGSGYAVGPSRANPYTGELYDADIRISADFVRSFYKTHTDFVKPLINPLSIDFENDLQEIDFPSNHCDYGEHLHAEMASAWDLMKASNIINGNDEELQKYIHDGLVDLVLHEVGHTLGLRHNFKASSIYSIEQLSDLEFTNKNGISGSVMDYQPVNIFDGQNFFQTKPGIYDYWAIEYAYKESNQSKMSEQKFLNKIASRSTDPLLRYGTDEDTYGLSTRGIDPHSNAWDLTNDPIKYYEKMFELSQALWDSIPTYFTKKGEKYVKIRNIFDRALRQYHSASRNIAKYIGGIYHSRHHMGDPGDKNPFNVVPATKQREALNFLINNILSKESFEFEPDLLNKLAPEREGDFRGRVWRMSRIDYPIHDYIRWIQSGTLSRLHNPRIFSRVRDNELKYLPGEEVFTLSELFQIITNSIWSEINNKENINSFRRDLQKSHIEILSAILLNEKNYFHSDAIALARISLQQINEKIVAALISFNKFDDYTNAHLNESTNKIQSVYKAHTVLN